MIDPPFLSIYFSAACEVINTLLRLILIVSINTFGSVFLKSLSFVGSLVPKLLTKISI